MHQVEISSPKTGLFARLWQTPTLLLALATLFWAGNFVVGRAILTETPPVALAFWRWTLALIPILWLGWKHWDIPQELRAIKANWPLITILAILGIGCFNTFVYFGLQQTSSVNALLLQSAMPLLILIVCFLIFGERPRILQLLGVILSLGGVVFIATRGHPEALMQMQVNAGDLWVFAAVVAYAFYSALLRKKPVMHPLSFLAITFAIGSIVLLPFYIREHMSGQIMHLSSSNIGALAYLVIFPSFLAYLFFNRGVELLGAARAGLFIHLIPVFGSVLALTFLGEGFEVFHIVGAGLIATGLIIASRKAAAKK